MKTITRTNLYLPMAAMILTAALAVPAAAQTILREAPRPDASRVPSKDRTPMTSCRREPRQ